MYAQTKQAYTEINNFIELLSEEDKNKIPKKLREFFKKEKDENYVKNIDIDIPIKEQNLLEETLALIALLNIKYLCNNYEEKERLIKIYNGNEQKYQELLKEKYNSDNLFKQKEFQKQNNVELIKYEETKWYRKIFLKILKIFKK